MTVGGAATDARTLATGASSSVMGMRMSQMQGRASHGCAGPPGVGGDRQGRRQGKQVGMIMASCLRIGTGYVRTGTGGDSGDLRPRKLMIDENHCGLPATIAWTGDRQDSAGSPGRNGGH